MYFMLKDSALKKADFFIDRNAENVEFYLFLRGVIRRGISAYIMTTRKCGGKTMILVKKTAVLSPHGVNGLCGVARFECFKDRSSVKINVNGGKSDLYTVIAVGEEKRAVRLCGDRIYLARTDLSGDCAVLVADGNCKVYCTGATVCGYDYAPLLEFLPVALGSTAENEGKDEEDDKKQVEKEIQTGEEKENAEEISSAEDIKEEKEVKSSENETMTETSVTVEEKSSSDVTAAVDMQKKADNTDSEITTNQTINTSESIGTEQAETESKEIKERFFDRIEQKIEKLFEENRPDVELSQLIPESRWVRVNTEDGWYVVGIVGDPAEFICYGIPDDNASNPPAEDEGCRQWLEVEKGGRGYWMMYQSAESGETLTAI